MVLGDIRALREARQAGSGQVSAVGQADVACPAAACADDGTLGSQPVAERKVGVRGGLRVVDVAVCGHQLARRVDVGVQPVAGAIGLGELLARRADDAGIGESEAILRGVAHRSVHRVSVRRLSTPDPTHRDETAMNGAPGNPLMRKERA